MTRIKQTLRFQADVRQAIWFLAQRNPRAAERYIFLIDETIQLLADHPELGEARPHLGDDIRKLSVPPYQMFYRARGEKVMLLRLLHSSQHITKILLG